MTTASAAEPRGIGTARARDPLAREVKLLGALLGQVIVEQAGEEALELVERVRRTMIGSRRPGGGAARRRLSAELDRIEPATAEMLIRAFSLYFQLTNLAEEKQRIRRLRQRQRSSPRGIVDRSVAEAVLAWHPRGRALDGFDGLLGRLRVSPVLTAHPTEARRRTLLVALRRAYRLLDQLDDPRLTPTEDAEVRRRLREEITLLWRTSAIRAEPPTPLDEVRTAMAFFDESLFVVTPRLYRALDGALDLVRRRDGAEAHSGGARDSGNTGTRRPHVGPFLAWGSWIGGDRDGNPSVTAAVTREALRIQADHVLRGYQAVCRRLMQTLAASGEPRGRLRQRLERDAREMPRTAQQLLRRFPDGPYRRRLGFMEARLERTRLRLAGDASASTGTDGAGYARAGELIHELDELSAALVEDGLARVAYGSVQDLRWQVETFGFHGPSLEVRQHSEVHAAALSAPARDAARAEPPDVPAEEVAETLRAMAELQDRYGPDACRRYVISFTRSAGDMLDVLELARRSLPDGRRPDIDVVPLFESADALPTCHDIVDEALRSPAYREHVRRRGSRQEVMLGYSDSTKESGALAAAWMLYRAQERLVGVGRAHGVDIVLFHGRGGAIGRGGGPMTRAVLAQAPGSVDGRLKLTEQGEVIADRYANPDIALRHLEQLSYAALVASTAEHERRARDAAADGSPVLDELAESARRAYTQLVWEDPRFGEYFRAATPVTEISRLTIGSRPAARQRSAGQQLDSLRAIPWVFAWSQSRANLPGWYGMGTALADFRRAHPEGGLARLRDLYRRWPFFASVIDNAEMSLAKADMSVARRYASLASAADGRPIWRRIRAEYRLSVAEIMAVTGHARLLDDMPVLQRSIELRNPYVDSLSELQVRLLGRMRSLPDDDPQRAQLMHLVHLTVSGVAAGLQSTG